ncbi:MAG: peptide-methionine (R)-S-oxide reductase MsrB [Pseudomonadota bacterium]
MDRRIFLTIVGASALASSPAVACGFEICRSEAEWRARLTQNEYLVLRDAKTERPFTSPLTDEMRPGLYHCRGCDLAVYDATAKYESRTGWPSFHESLRNAVGTQLDRRYVLLVRTAVYCRRCGSHLGHIFDDDPAPTGKRHCLNGLSLVFVPAQ